MSSHATSTAQPTIDDVDLAKVGAAVIAGHKPKAVDPEPLTLTETRAADRLGVSAGFFKKHVLPEIRVIRRGTRVLVPQAELERWIERNAARTVE